MLLTTALFLQPKSADFKTIPGHGEGEGATARLEVGKPRAAVGQCVGFPSLEYKSLQHFIVPEVGSLVWDSLS